MTAWAHMLFGETLILTSFPMAMIEVRAEPQLYEPVFEESYDKTTSFSWLVVVESVCSLSLTLRELEK